MKKDPLTPIRDGSDVTGREALRIITRLSVPAILAMLASVLMQYIDASMVGSLGANASAAIGLVSSTTWLIGWIVQAAGVGFTVLIAHAIGAGNEIKARAIVKGGLAFVMILCGFFTVLSVVLAPHLPRILGGEEAIYREAYLYFLIWALSLPLMQIRFTAGGMLECSGNIRLPSILNILMCVLNVVFNAVLIFPQITVPGTALVIPGAGLGVVGAALATTAASAVAALSMLGYLLFGSEALRLRRGEKEKMSRKELGRAVKISLPVALQSAVTGGAYVAATGLVAPLGSVAVAANSLSITAESVCYMPSAGIATAATTIVGQSIGAKRHDLTGRLGWTVVFFGIAVQTVSGALLYIFAPQMIGLLSPVPEIRALGTQVLRLEAFAEPLYGASQVALGVLRGLGDTFVPSILNFATMWLIRLPLAAFVFIPRSGLYGYWTAMVIELVCRGLIFLCYLRFRALRRVRGKEV